MSAMTGGMISRKAKTMRTSAVRELMKRMGAADVISFGGGLPAPELFPVAQISAAASAVLAENPHSALQYSTSEGFSPLREFIATNLMGRLGVECDADEIVITSGSQQGLDLLARVLIDPGDNILVERPSYLAALQAFDQSQPVYHGIELLDDGPDLSVLECHLRQLQPKFFYAIPDFQNPSGICYSGEKRKEIAGMLQRNDTLLIEDGPYALLSYDHKPCRALCSFSSGNAIYLGTFSKILAPGMRLGWLYAPQEIQKYIVRARQAADLCPSIFTQQIVWRLMQEFDFDGHIKNICSLYSHKREVMLEALDRYMPEGIAWTKPAGGMFLWLTLPDDINTTAVLESALEKGVLFTPGESFYREKPAVNTMRLNFTHGSDMLIDKGIKLLAQVIEKYL